jgi:hypothetical protein
VLVRLDHVAKLYSDLVPSKIYTIVLGGTAASHAYRAWGAVIFVGCRMLRSRFLIAVGSGVTTADGTAAAQKSA